jgi:hypothetical protein
LRGSDVPFDVVSERALGIVRFAQNAKFN